MNKQINGLRALLCIFIVFYHFVFSFNNRELGFFPNPISFWGLFFVLSGYFMNLKSVKKFWLKRIVKLIIPYIISVTIILLIKLAILKNSYNVSIVDYFANISGLLMLSGKFDYIDGAHWYYCKLLSFFVIASFIKVVSKVAKKDKLFDIILAVFGVAISLYYVYTMFFDGINLLNVLLDPRYLFLVFGYFLRFVFQNKKGRLSLLFLVPILLFIYKNSFFINVFYFSFLMAVFYLCYIQKVHFLENRLFQIVGKSSMYIYLLHQEIGYLILGSIKPSLVSDLFVVFLMIVVGCLFTVCYDKIVEQVKKQV